MGGHSLQTLIKHSFTTPTPTPCIPPHLHLPPQILLIPELGQQGGSQLAADAEYFCNVVAALHGTPPPSLLTVQLFAGQPPAQFAEAARQAAAEGGADLPTLRMLATMRHLPPP